MPNRRLLSPEFRVWSERGQETPLASVDASCHFLHSGPGAVAAFSACRDHALVSMSFTYFQNSKSFQLQMLKYEF